MLVAVLGRLLSSSNIVRREVLVAVLGSLRSHPHVMLAAMNAFIQEPTLDWLQLAAREAM